MSTLFFADLIPWMSCCLFILFCVWYIFYAFAHFFQALFLFFGCASSLLDESSEFNVFLWNLLSLFCCCCLACFFIVFFFSFMSLLTCNTTEPASSSECAHRAWCSPPTMWPDSSFTVLRSECLHLSPAASTASFSMVSVHVPSTSSASASVFSLFCLCCCNLIFCLCFCIFAFCLRCCFFCGGGFSFDFFNDLLVSFFELRLLNFNVFHCLVSPSCFIISCFPL